MASDFGDEAGGELYSWMLRVGQDANVCRRSWNVQLNPFILQKAAYSLPRSEGL